MTAPTLGRGSPRRRLATLATLLLTAPALALAGLVATAGPAAAEQFAVGVLPDRNGVCPTQTSAGWFILQDNETHRNENGTGGWIGGVGINHDTTRIPLCLTNGDRFTGMLGFRVNFAVISLGPSCPAGSIAFDRYVDDEDVDNHNNRVLPGDSGSSQPGGRNTRLRFCWFVNTNAASPVALRGSFPNLGGRYGVFASMTAPFAYEAGYFHTDDEDQDNENGLTAMDSTRNSLRAQWLIADRNTTYRVARVAEQP